MSLSDYEDEDELESEESSKQSKGGNVKGIDADAFADALVSRLESRQTTQQAPDKDEVLETINYLRGEGYNDDYIRAQILSLGAQEKKLERKLEKALSEREAKAAREIVTAQAKSHINTELRSIFKESPELKEFSREIRAGIDAALEDHKGFWSKFNRGEVDLDVLDEVIERVEKKFSRLTGAEPGKREKSVNTAMKPAAPGGNARAKASMKEQDIVVNEDDLADHQLPAYYSFLSTNMRRLGMSEEEAKKDAFATARQLENIRPKKSVLD